MSPISPITGDALLGAGFNLASGFGNLLMIPSQQHYQRKMMRYQSELQKDLMAQQNAYNLAILGKQYDQNISLWNMQNEYNEPIRQRERLEAAGINPYAMFGQAGQIGLSHTAPSAPSASGVGFPSVSAPPAPNMDTTFISDSVQKFLTSRLLGEQTREQSAKAAMSEIDMQFRAMQNLMDLSNKYTKNREMLANANLSKSERDGIEMENSIILAAMPETISLMRSQPEKLAKEMKVLDATYDKTMDDIATNAVERAVKKSQINLNSATYNQIIAATKRLYAEIENIQANTELTYEQAHEAYQRAEKTFWDRLNSKLSYLKGSSTYDLFIEDLQSDIDLNREYIEDSQNKRMWRNTTTPIETVVGAGQGAASGYNQFGQGQYIRKRPLRR